MNLSTKEIAAMLITIIMVIILMSILINKTLNSSYIQADEVCKKELTCKPGNVSTYVYRNGCMCIEAK